MPISCKCFASSFRRLHNVPSLGRFHSKYCIITPFFIWQAIKRRIHSSVSRLGRTRIKSGSAPGSRPSTPCRRGPPPPGSSNSCRFRTRPSLHRPGRSSCQRRHATARTRTPTAKRMQTGSLRSKLRRFAVDSGEEKGCIAPKKSARGCDRRRCISNGPLHRARCKAEPMFGFRRGGKRTQ